MSDFFIPTQKDDYWTKKQQETQTTLPQQNNQNDYWGQRSQALQQQKEEQLANYNRYGVDVPDEYYEQFNKIISQVEDPAQAQEEAYRIGSAIKYSQMYGMPIEEAYKKVDALNEAQFPDLQDQKGRFEAICDMFTLGNNNVKLGMLGQKLMTATGNNDTEMIESLMSQIDALQQENVLLQDKTPRKWVMQALEAGAQSLPFTGYVAGAGIFGNFIAPGVGAGAAFATSSYLAAGQEYLDMRANGASHETAAIVSSVSGLIQGLIEADLGITKGIVKGTAKAMSKDAVERVAKKSLEDIGTKIAKRFHFGPGKKLLVNYLKEYGKNVLGEGTEEFLQEITSIIGQEIAASLDGYDIPDDDFNHIVKQTTEAFYGGVLGALSIGFIPAGINGAADIKSFKQIKDIAEEYESGEMFKEAVKENPVFKGMSDEQKADVIQEVWEKAQQRKEAEVELEARQIAETRDAAEGAEEMPEAEEGEETQAQSVARDESGRLYTNDDGNTFLVGDATKDDANRYGYIKYSTDEKGDITIDTFKMTEGREGLREELFDEFARQHPDVNINWNAVGSEAQAMRQSLIDANPSGAKNGLNYYSSQDLDQVAARKKVAAEVRKNIHNVTKNADGSFTRTDLNNNQVAAAVTLIESAAKRMDMSLSDYVSKTFGNQIFGSREEFAQSALAQGEQINDKAGGMNQGVAQTNWKQVGQQIKAVIYAGENADFSTWAHEMAHVFQNQLDGNLKTDAETAFNVVNGDWINSKYTFSDGRTMSSAEAFAYGFQDWLETGHAESQQMQNIFQKFAQFIADCYNKLRQHLNFTPEIESVFNRLLDGDDAIMSKALKAAQEEENEYRASLKRKAEEAEATKKAEAEEAQRQAELEKEEAAEYTDYEQETTEQSAEEIEQSAEEIEQQLEEGNEKETDNAIDNALENLNISDEQKAKTAEVLKDETSTIAEKADAIVDAAGEQFDLFQKQQLLFQEGAEFADEYIKEEWNKDKKELYEELNQFAHYTDINAIDDNELFNKLRMLGALNATVKKGYRVSKTYLDYDIYSLKSYLLNRVVERAKTIPTDIKLTTAMFYYRNKDTGIQLSFHTMGELPYRLSNTSILLPPKIWETYGKAIEAKDEEYSFYNSILEEKGKEDNLWDGVNAAWSYDSAEEYKKAVEEKKRAAIVNNSSSRPNIYESRNYDNNNIITENANILFQIAGEIGAQNLDDAETQEGVSRMQNLAIAKQMETEGKDAKAIRLATGWEKGADGKWRWEIDDSNVHFDLYSAMEEWDNEHPRYNVQTRMNFTPEERREALLAATEDVAPEDKIILFQTVYHGSGADFDKFDTENYGLSGEGSMSFGYGTYLTDSEEIARDYAERQRPYKKETLLYKGRKPETDTEKFISGLIEQANGVYETVEELKKYLEGLIKNEENAEKIDPDYVSSILNTYKSAYELLSSKDFDIKDVTWENEPKTRLYTVEIPDDGYLDFNKKVGKKIVKKIAEELEKRGYKYPLGVPEYLNNAPFTDKILYGISHDVGNIGTNSGTYADLYELIGDILAPSENRNMENKKASAFLHSIGYAGIKYPAGTIHGNGNGAYNYVIFNDDDAKIIDHLLFQTNAELMQEAQGFESWQEFMEFCEVMHGDDEVSPIPSEADAQWYQSFWETAHGLQTEQEKNEQAVKDKYEQEGNLPTTMDALFTAYIRSNSEMLDDFIHEVARLDEIDLNSDEWRNVEDDLQAAERDKIDTLKDAIAITMSDYNWQSAMRRIQGGGEISEGMRKRLLGEMTDSFKTRDFRALYAEVMEDAQYAVDEADTTSAMLSKKLQKYQKRYYDIVKPGEDISKMSPEKRKRIAEAMANRDIANKIRNGSLKLDDELDSYIKSLDRQIKEKQKQFDELEKETKADYQRIADAERRRLLKLHDELLIARSKLTQKNSDTARKINKGLKITEKYKRESQNLQANYDELFRKFNDLKNTIQITAEVQAALDRQEQVASVREDLNAKQKEKNLTAEVKKMRINLVKRTMRRVPFNRIDYDNAKTVIAIQRMLEPNLIGGVNKFIGIDSPFLRGVISQIVTDSDYKEKILRYLDKNSRSSEAFVNFKKKLSEMKSIKDFDSWTAKERKAAIKYLPKENWVKDLNLMELAKEREESIDLDIDTEEYSRQAYDENGKPKTYKDKDGIEHNVMETAFRLRYSDELGQLVKDAVGADMFDRIVNRPFSEWTTEELEQLAQRIDELYTEGRDLLAAKNEARKREAEAIRKRVEDAIKDTGIVINDEDPPEEKERKQKEINKILNLNSGLKGTEAGNEKGIKATLDRLIHGYEDMNVLRFGRMLDNQTDGENVYMLYRREDECYNNKTRSINNRARTINEIMKANNITEGDLAKSIPVPSLNTEFTVDELLYFLAADKDYAEDETKLAKGLFGIDANDDWAATSRNAVMFGNMMSDTASQEQKEAWAELDKQMQDAISNDTLTTEQKQLKAMGQLDEHPGTSAYINYCHAKWETVLGAANSFIAEHPEYKALMEAIEADYAAQYERMNEVSINEFNMPVHRVRAYVPLVRCESNGDTNVNQVKEDLLATFGSDAGKQWVNKGMTQRRVNISPLHQKPVQTGLFATWGSSVDRTEHFIAYAPYVRQLNAIYKSRDAAYTRRWIESRYGKYAVEYLDKYINEVANPNAGKIREAGSEWLHALRGKTAPAYLGWKFSAIVKQGLTSPWPYMQFVNPAEYAAAALECTRKGTYDAIKEKSVFMNNRVMDPMNELVEEMADEGKTKFDRALGKFGKKGMAGLEWIDWVCVAPGWLACYKKEYARLQRASEARYEAKMEELRERNMYADIATSQYMTPDQMEAQARKEIMEDIEVEAVRYADDCTRQCQPSSRAADLAPLFKNRSEAMKAFLQFQTSLNVIWQNIRYDMPYAVRNKQFQRIVGTILGYVFAGIFMNSVMEGVTSGAKDDDDKDLQALRNLIFYSTTQFTDAVPIMGSELTNMMDQMITGKRGFMNSGTDMTPSATKMLSAFTNATKGNWEKAATLSAEAIGMAAGAPVSGTKEVYKLLGKPLENGDVNLKRGLSDVYGIAGDIIEE